jgi:hypothetical protein
MTTLLFFVALVALLLGGLTWFAFANKRRTSEKLPIGGHEREITHISNLPYIKQAQSKSDFDFLKRNGSPALANRIHNERKKITLTYLAALRKDFDRILHTLRVLALMSPNVQAVTEIRTLKLRAEFSYLYYSIYLRLQLGIAPFESISQLSHIISALTVQLESAMSQLTEQAALPDELLP